MRNAVVLISLLIAIVVGFGGAYLVSKSFAHVELAFIGVSR